MTDNGSCYIAHDYRRALRSLGLTHLRIRPGRPRTNGKAERLIQTLLNEWAYARIYGSSSERTASLLAYLDLIRHAYERPGNQRRGIGGALLRHVQDMSGRRLLVGTWAAADWAIAFYRRHGFELVTPQRKDELLRMYWSIPERQIETSVVLASPPFGPASRG